MLTVAMLEYEISPAIPRPESSLEVSVPESVAWSPVLSTLSVSLPVPPVIVSVAEIGLTTPLTFKSASGPVDEIGHKPARLPTSMVSCPVPAFTVTGDSIESTATSSLPGPVSSVIGVESVPGVPKVPSCVWTIVSMLLPEPPSIVKLATPRNKTAPGISGATVTSWNPAATGSAWVSV